VRLDRTENGIVELLKVRDLQEAREIQDVNKVVLTIPIHQVLGQKPYTNQRFTNLLSCRRSPHCITTEDLLPHRMHTGSFVRVNFVLV